MFGNPDWRFTLPASSFLYSAPNCSRILCLGEKIRQEFQTKSFQKLKKEGSCCRATKGLWNLLHRHKLQKFDEFLHLLLSFGRRNILKCFAPGAKISWFQMNFPLNRCLNSHLWGQLTYSWLQDKTHVVRAHLRNTQHSQNLTFSLMAKNVKIADCVWSAFCLFLVT